MLNPTTKTKTCTRCKKQCTPAHFHKNGPRLRSQCKTCVNQLERERYARKNRQKAKSTSPDLDLVIQKMFDTEPREVLVLRARIGDVVRKLNRLHREYESLDTQLNEALKALAA